MDESISKTLNKIQEILMKYQMADHFKVPMVAVIGSQSAGKSSLLELLIKDEFLPKGEGIVTRTPILVQSMPNKELTKTRIKFEHIKDKYFEDLSRVRDEILSQTEKLAGKGKGVSGEPIIIKIEGPNTAALSFVDLPGLTKIPVSGQPEDIESQIWELNRRFIENPNCIILALAPATNDIATSESLKLSMKIDPSGERTLCVLTKMDLFEGSERRLDEVLRGKLLPLKNGYIAVSTRLGKDDAESLAERFPNIDPDNLGKAALKNRLGHLLAYQVNEALPELKSGLQEILKVR